MDTCSSYLDVAFDVWVDICSSCEDMDVRRRVSEAAAAAALHSFPVSVNVQLYLKEKEVVVVLHSFPVSVNVQLYLKEKVVVVLRSFPVSEDCNFAKRPFSSRLFRVFSASRLRSIFSALPSVSLPYFS